MPEVSCADRVLTHIAVNVDIAGGWIRRLVYPAKGANLDDIVKAMQDDSDFVDVRADEKGDLRSPEGELIASYQTDVFVGDSILGEISEAWLCFNDDSEQELSI